MADGIVGTLVPLEKLRPTKNRDRKQELCCVQCGVVRKVEVKRRANKGNGPTSGLCKRCSALRAARIKSEIAAIRNGFRFDANRQRLRNPGKYAKRRELIAAKRAELIERRKLKQTLICPVCGSALKGRGFGYCSKECQLTSNRRAIRERNRERLKAKGSYTCPWCSVVFSPLFGYGKSQFCSADCQRAYVRDKVHAETSKRRVSGKGLYATTVLRSKIFERDGWHCKACGCHTPKRLMGTLDDNAPQQDHVVPIAKGGTHEESNLQLLCRLCNQLKGVMSMDKFMSLYFRRAS